MLSRSTGKVLDVSIYDDPFIREMYGYLESISQKEREPFVLKKIDRKILEEMILDFYHQLVDKDLSLEYRAFIKRSVYNDNDDAHMVRCYTHQQIIRLVCIPELVDLDTALTHIHEFAHYYFFTRSPKMYYYLHNQEFMSIFVEFLASYLFDSKYNIGSKYGLEAYRTSAREAWDFASSTDFEKSTNDVERKSIVEGKVDPDNRYDGEEAPSIEDIIWVLKDYTYKTSHVCAYKMLQLYKDDPQKISKILKNVFRGGLYIEEALKYFGISPHNFETIEPTIQRIRSRVRYDK